ncbi:MAG: TM0106 family RecB-like putative nuclease [Nitrospira sp.]
MKQLSSGQLLFSPSDLVRYLASPFASWMDRYHLEQPSAVVPDEATEEAALIAQTGERHEQVVLQEFRSSGSAMIEIPTQDQVAARSATRSAISAKVPVIYQAALEHEAFSGFADFLLLDDSGRYQVWDTKLARSPRPYYAIQLCCYSEMLAAMSGEALPETFGVILGTKERVSFRIEDFIHYYRHIKTSFLSMQQAFTGNVSDRPEPLPRADHGRWSSQAEAFFEETDHLVQVAGITVGQIKKLKRAGITTVTGLAGAADRTVPKLDQTSLGKLAAQARLQCQTRADRIGQPEAPPRYETLPCTGMNGEPVGLATLPPDHPADVFFDMEGYPLATGGLEYLFGCCTRTDRPDAWDFRDWWAHDREGEKSAFEGFVDWAYARWRQNRGLHIFHYAAYEVSAVRRLSTQHDTRQDEVDELLRHSVFVDLYQVVRHGLRIGEDSYSIKSVERLYRPKRATTVATAGDSIVQYARWIESGEPRDWNDSPILKGIRDYNEDDCRSTAQLLQWLRQAARDRHIPLETSSTEVEAPARREVPPEIVARLETAAKLRKGSDAVSALLADVIDFHRREKNPCGGACSTAPGPRRTRCATIQAASKAWKR